MCVCARVCSGVSILSKDPDVSTLPCQQPSKRNTHTHTDIDAHTFLSAGDESISTIAFVCVCGKCNTQLTLQLLIWLLTHEHTDSYAHNKLHALPFTISRRRRCLCYRFILEGRCVSFSVLLMFALSGCVLVCCVCTRQKKKKNPLFTA